MAIAVADRPPGWSYNPSAWSERLPIAAAALLGTAIAAYLALFQVGLVRTVWEPFFGDGSRVILTSSVSRVLPDPRQPRPIAVSEVLRPLRWAVLPLAVWLAAAPWILGSAGAATVNGVVSGLLVTALGPLGGEVRQHFGGGWRAVVRRAPR